MYNVGKTNFDPGGDNDYTDCTDMEVLYTAKVINNGSSKAIILPRPVIDGLGWKRGDRVVFTFAGEDQLIVRRLTDEMIREIKSFGGELEQPDIDIDK